ncbi:DUF881 domain-containing protein [Anaerosolibacter sp.]|jgi:uncharacterized protein YlxW (UPF0749 family)|uniref:DUF881 domain-containing protein n=1 Tax=Anaerosolibacter sp. TaxID=1872527 RepID=UPI00261CAEA5|nr:DUF881 domain-containing protein [Anaerosolibacter sp.]MDF2546889.1 hypothetical protein [Anaerosolibacter sp.]
MKGIKGQVAVAIVCLVLGLVLSIQFKSVQESDIDWGGSTQKSQRISRDLKIEKEEKQQLLGSVDLLQRRMKEIEDVESKEDGLLKNLSAELEKYKMISGVKAVKGKGVIVVVDDPPMGPDYPSDLSIIMINYDLLLSLINKLNDAGAEAISINDQRIVSNTEIHLAGNNVNINSVPTAPPFIVKAIGNPNTLESALNIRFGIIWQMKDNYNLQVSIKQQDEVVIPRYDKITKFVYATTLEEQKPQ